MSATNAVEDIILNYLFNDTVPPVLGPVYLALFTADPGETASYAAEVSGGSYARQLITFTTASGGGSVSNDSVIDTPIATANWGTVTHFAIVNAASGSGGYMLVRGALASPQTINIGQKFQAAIGDLVCSHT